MNSNGWFGPVVAALVMVAGYVGYNEYAKHRKSSARNEARNQYCEWLVVQMRMHKGEGKLDQLSNEFDTLNLRCPEPEWTSSVLDAPAAPPIGS